MSREWLRHARTSPLRPADPEGGRMFDAVIVAMHKWPYLPSNWVMEKRARIMVDELRAAGFRVDRVAQRRASRRTQHALSAREPSSQSASVHPPVL